MAIRATLGFQVIPELAGIPLPLDIQGIAPHQGIQDTPASRDTAAIQDTPVTRGNQAIVVFLVTQDMEGQGTAVTVVLGTPVMAGQGIVDIPDYRAILVYPGTRLRGHQATPVTQEYQGIAEQVVIRAILPLRDIAVIPDGVAIVAFLVTPATAGLVILVMEGQATQAMAVPGTVAIAGQE